MKYLLKLMKKKRKPDIGFLKNVFNLVRLTFLYIIHSFIKCKSNVILKLNKKSNKSFYLYEKSYFYENKKNWLIYLYIIIISIIIVKSRNIQIFKYRKFLSSNYIIIKTLGTGSQSILYPEFRPQPDEVSINGVPYSIDDENKISNLQNEENYITLKWNEQLGSCSSMFMELTNIIEVVLSNFDSSKVTKMDQMFYDCINLQSIKINNIDTKSVTDMSLMFVDCKSLISLDISNLNTMEMNKRNNKEVQKYFIGTNNKQIDEILSEINKFKNQIRTLLKDLYNIFENISQIGNPITLKHK